MKNTTLVGLLSCLLWIVTISQLSAATQWTLFVSPKGNDANNGKTAATPFATLGRAREVVRSLN